MAFTAPQLVGKALARWILSDLDRSNDFAREGLPACDAAALFEALAATPSFPSSAFSIALVGFGVDGEALTELAADAGLRGLRGLTTDLHVATGWRNDRGRHPRVVALASGHNPSVHGLRFFPRASSSRLAAMLLDWARGQSAFTATPKHRELLENLRDRAGLASLRSLDGVAAFLEAWSRRSAGSIDAPRDALAALGLLPDPRLFEADDQGAELERNLLTGERLTILSPGELRLRRQKAGRYRDRATREAVVAALDRLEAHRRGDGADPLTLEEAALLVKLPPDRSDVPDGTDEVEGQAAADAPGQDGGARELYDQAVDALLGGREDDLDAIGAALEAAWDGFDESGDTLAGSADLGGGQVDFEQCVDVGVVDWVSAFCAADRFGGLIETEVVDLRQALARHAEADPLFIDVEAVWRHAGSARSMAALFEGWDRIEPGDGSRGPLLDCWRRFLELRGRLAAPRTLRALVVHPREWLDTHADARADCRAYLAAASELYGGVQRRYRTVREHSRDWANATVDALLSLDLVQVAVSKPEGGAGAKAVMLPLHPLHLWRHLRFSELLRGFASGAPLPDADRVALVRELRRPEQFLGVIRVGATPGMRGLDQHLPLANEIEGVADGLGGLATFENFRNAVSNIDGVDTLAMALDHYVLLHPNHARPLRLALVNPPEPARLLERVARLLDERRAGAPRFAALEVTVYATAAHRDRLLAAATLEGRSQDLVYEKVASGRLDLRVAAEPAENLSRLVEGDLAERAFHLVAIFDESTTSVRRRRIERYLPMSPFCRRSQVEADTLLGVVGLSPLPGDPPFSDFVMMINELDQQERDNALVSCADADMLRSVVDGLLLEGCGAARWVLLADRALPGEVGMRAVRLLERKDGHRRVLLAAAGYGRLETVMRDAFDTCNLTVTDETLGGILRQGVNLVGAGLLDMVKKQSGQADTSKVVGFVGMLLAARDVTRGDPDALVASVDGVLARLWLRLGASRAGERCDLIVLRRGADRSFRLTCVEVKTTLEATMPDEEARIAKAVAQIRSTAAVLRDAVVGDGLFSAPRSEMLKEVLVGAAANRTGDDEADAALRCVWGPWLQELFSGADFPASLRIDGEVVVVRLRSADAPRRAPYAGESEIPIMVRHITEPLAEELVAAAAPAPPPRGGGSPPPGTAREIPPGPVRPRGPDRGSGPGATARAGRSPPAATIPQAHARREGGVEAPSTVVTRDAGSSADWEVPPAPHGAAADPPADGATWPPAPNALGLIGQDDVARELVNQARKARGWGQRFPDKLFVGPAGVGKTTLARGIAERLLGLEPIIFNGADLRRAEMIADRLRDLGLVPGDLAGTVAVGPCLIFVDEVHAIAPGVATVLLSALDQARHTTIDNVVHDFGQVVFLLATTDPGKLTEAFQSRPQRTTLRSYTLAELAGIVWLHAGQKLEGASLDREACVEVAARMQCSPRGSVNVLEALISSFYGAAEGELGDVPTRSDVARRMTAGAIARWFSETLGIDANGLGSIHMDYLGLLQRRGATSEDEVRRGLGISNRGDFVEVSEYLTRLGLIRTGPGGRGLTGDGRRYLNTGGAMDLRDRISRRVG